MIMQTLIPPADEFLQDKQPYAYWLSQIPSIGKQTIFRLLEHFEYPDEIYHASEKNLKPFLSKKQLEQLLQSRSSFPVMEAYQSILAKKIRFLPYYHPAFPSKLKNIPDPPYCIFYRGTLPRRNEPLIAIIGARDCSEYGRQTASYFAKSLASAGIGIVSGLARGIDGISQYEALQAGGRTYGILGNGVDICYPRENEPLFHAIPKRGALLSEFPPGTEPKAQFFPMRNRLISGLADALLVIEAREKSGTLITVDMALEQGREVFAIPGRICDPLSYGCNRLIKQGATPVMTPQDMIRDLCMDSLRYEESPNQKCTALLSPKEQCILHTLQYEPMSLDKLYASLLGNPSFSSLSIPELIHTLTQLTLKGVIINSQGNYSLPMFA